MMRVDLHPEDLFDHLRCGELRAEERERLENHCARCSACAFELQLIIATRDAEPTAEDHAVAARAMERMLPTHAGDHAAPQKNEKDTEAPIVLPVRGQGLFRAAALLLAGVLVGGTMSAAALTGSSPFVLIDRITAWVVEGEPTASASAPTASAVSPKTAHARTHRESAQPTNPTASVAVVAVGEHAASALPATTATTSAPSSAAAKRRVAPVAAVRAVAPNAEAASTQASAPVDPSTWLFRAASRARAGGRYLEAAALYGVLQSDYAGSETEVVARVALGRLWLGQLENPTNALKAFDSYLAARPSGSLAEEALSGRVGALRKLGRFAEAENAMGELMTTYPNTLYAATP